MLGKDGLEKPVDHALGRSRGGLTTEIHNVVSSRSLLSPDKASDISNAHALTDQLHIPGKPGLHRKRCRWLPAIKGYDAEYFCQYYDRYRM